MGVKWTCVLLFLLGTANLLVESISAPDTAARLRGRRAVEDFVTNEFSAFRIPRNKRDVSTIVDDNGNQVTSTSSSGDDGQSYSYTSTNRAGAGSSSSASSGARAFSPAIPRFGGGPAAFSSRNSFPSGNSGNPWAWGGQTPAAAPGSSSWVGDNQNYQANVGYNPYYPNQYYAPPGGYGFNFEDFLQQYFRALEAHHRAVQAQFQNSQPQTVSGGSYAWAHAGAYMTGSNGVVEPNARVYSHSSTFTPSRSTGGGRPRKQHGARHPRVGKINRFRSSGFNQGSGFGNGFGGSAGWNPAVSRGAFQQEEFNIPNGGNIAFSSTSLGPKGGLQHAEISPAPPGIVSRIHETYPSPSGNSFGTFSSSSSKTISSRNPDGTVTNKHEKSSTSAINDNGKVTVYTVKDP